MMFCEYLGTVQKHPNTFELMSKEIKVVDLEWASKDNYVDCGIFLMKHLECCKDNIFNDLKNQFDVECQQKQVVDLRKKFLAKILLCDFNDDVQRVKDAVVSYDKLEPDVRLINKLSSDVNIAKRVLGRS